MDKLTPTQTCIPPILKRTEYGFAEIGPGHGVILLVEDNPGDVVLVREALERNQVMSQIFLAEDGEQALQLAEQIDASELPCPDLIVLDLNLPKVSGFKVLERLRASPKCGDKPVAILSSADSAADRMEAQRLGASSYIRKPFDLGGLTAVGRELKRMLYGGA